MIFLAVDSIQPLYKSRFDDGKLGLAASTLGSQQNEVNFMSQLLLNGIIKNNVFSIYFSEDSPGHINFGGWEKEGVDPEEKDGLTMLDTVSKNTWGISIGEFVLDNTTIDINNYFTCAIFDPGYSFLYLPLADWSRIAKKINYRVANGL